jgi:hypothetical protein
MTRFFGYKVVLLGCFNAQLLRDEVGERSIARRGRVDGHIALCCVTISYVLSIRPSSGW